MKNGRSWAEVDLSCIVNNYNIYKRFAGKNVMAVVKANAYGHGAVRVARHLQEKVDFFAVATLEEGLELREAGIHKPILDLGYISPAEYEDMILADIRPSIYHLEDAEQNGVDFQLSGHTHYGQVWPISWITDYVYECSFGEHQRGNTRYYVSSGLGIWGGKFRIGTRSEYVVVIIDH